MKVLFLTPWYPSEKDAMAGLFVQKHVEAVRAQGVDVRVIDATTWSGIWRAWRALQREGWMPEVVQLNVIQKQGLLALYLKRRYHIPYVIIEHWTGYLPENMSVSPKGLHTEVMKLICKEAEVIMPVSEHLAKAMRTLGFKAKRWEKINNVVDDFFYNKPQTTKKTSTRKTLLNITCFDEPHKNVKGLLRAAKALSEKRLDWQLVLVGTGVDFDDVRAYAESLEFPDGLLVWAGELTPREVAIEFDKADIFVLTSRFENAPVVISESIVKGVPVISTNVGGISEMINKNSGILIKPENDEELIETLFSMLDHYQAYDSNTIQLEGRQYSYEVVGKKLKKIYEQACGTQF